MDTLDPRHGTHAGYLTHRRDGEDACDPCSVANYRQRKQNDCDRLNGVQMLYSADEVRAAVDPWLVMGLTPSAIMAAAGFESQRGGRLARLLADGGVVRRGTYHALAAVTEDDFSPKAKVYADLTRTRIYSLMAIGQRLADMPLNPRGKWRHYTHVSVGIARDIRDHYAANEFVVGTQAQTAARALNAGHKPPLSWDDPGTLAWPAGRRPRTRRTVVDIFDEAVILRILGGERVRANTAERREVCRRWVASGRSLNALEKLTGWATHRYFKVGEDAA